MGPPTRPLSIADTVPDSRQGPGDGASGGGVAHADTVRSALSRTVRRISTRPFNFRYRQMSEPAIATQQSRGFLPVCHSRTERRDGARKVAAADLIRATFPLAGGHSRAM